MKKSGVLTLGLMLQGGAGWLGGALYVENLCRSLLTLLPDSPTPFRLVLFGNTAQLDGVKYLAGAACRLVNLEHAPPIGFRQRQFYRLQRFVFGYKTPWFDRMMQDEGVDFLYPYCAQDAKPKDFRSAAWMPDFQHAVIPEMFGVAELQERDAGFRHMLTYAESIVLSSNSARTHCQNYYPEALRKVKVLEFPSLLEPSVGADSPNAVATFNLPEKFFLVSNQFWRHKNHGIVFEALHLLKAQGLDIVVVCTGHTYDYRKPQYFDELLGEIHKSNLAEQVRILGVVPRALQLQLMQAAQAIIQPSLFEGWNTTVEDARAMGCPIILSDIGVHLEQAPPQCAYFESTSAASLALEMRRNWEHEKTARGSVNFQALRTAQRQRVNDFARKFLSIAGAEA